MLVILIVAVVVLLAVIILFLGGVGSGLTLKQTIAINKACAVLINNGCAIKKIEPSSYNVRVDINGGEQEYSVAAVCSKLGIVDCLGRCGCAS
jgi:hypothetical protein